MAKLKGGMALDFSLEKSRVKEEVGQCHLLFVFSSKVLFCQESITQEYESGFRFVLISVRKCLLMECFHVTSRWPCWCPQLIRTPGIELYYNARVFFCFDGKTRLLIT